MIICCFARWRGEGRFAKQTKEAPLAVVGKVFDVEQPVSTKSFVFSEDTLTSVDEAPPKASLVYADAPAVEVVVKTATARPLRCRRLRTSSSDPRRPRGDLRTMNRQDSIDAPAMVASSISRIKKNTFFDAK